MKILRNMVRCTRCDDIIESKDVHDFKWCSCHSVAVCGGREYLKRCFSSSTDFEELSTHEEPTGTVRITVYAHASNESMYDDAKRVGLSDAAASYLAHWEEVELELDVEAATGQVLRIVTVNGHKVSRARRIENAVARRPR